MRLAKNRFWCKFLPFSSPRFHFPPYIFVLKNSKPSLWNTHQFKYNTNMNTKLVFTLLRIKKYYPLYSILYIRKILRFLVTFLELSQASLKCTKKMFHAGLHLAQGRGTVLHLPTDLLPGYPLSSSVYRRGKGGILRGEEVIPPPPLPLSKWHCYTFLQCHA